MKKKLRQMRWNLYEYKSKRLLLLGLKNNRIRCYDDELIMKLRNIYYGGLPASIILLTNGLSNGYCYDRALLMSQAFLDSDDDVKLVYADVDSLKLNPKYIQNKYPNYADHCFVERITKEGKHLIYDTASGFVYDKKMYWLIEHPKIRHINDKESIIKFVNDDMYYNSEDMERDKYISPLILPNIEKCYGSPYEMYSISGIELLQREVEHYKKEINYDSICEEIREDMNIMMNVDDFEVGVSKVLKEMKK